jgi:hypothetical protein
MPLTGNKSNKIYDVEFFVVWNANRRTFDVHQGDAETGVFARDKLRPSVSPRKLYRLKIKPRLQLSTASTLTVS